MRAAFVLLLVALAGACRDRGDELPTDRRIRLAFPADSGSTLAIDAAGRVWVGTAGRLAHIDTAGRAVASFRVPGSAAPRLLWGEGARLYVETGGRIGRVETARGAAALHDRARGALPAARDPRGRWVFATLRNGGVVGLDPATLRPLWGWPEAGSRAGALAVSPLADRVYLALDGSEERDLETEVQVRDALTGRVLHRSPLPEPLRSLAAAPDGTLFGHGEEGVHAFRHGPAGVEALWKRSPRAVGLPRIDGVRVDPAGRRLAVFARGEGGGVRLLDARSGETVGRTDEAPLDAAFGIGGRLWILERQGVRVVR